MLAVTKCVEFMEQEFNLTLSKQLRAALADFNESIRLNPNEAFLFVARGLTYIRLAKYNLALEDFNQAITLDPTLGQAYYYRGLVYGIQGKREEAIADLQTSLTLPLAPDLQEQAEQMLEQLGASK